MQIEVYEKIKSGLENYFSQIQVDKNYIPEAVVGVAPNSPKYPYVAIKEITNVPYGNFTNVRQMVDDLSYRIDIYAKDISKDYSKQKVARNIMLLCDNYMTCIGLKRISFNEFEEGNKQSISHIILVYSGRFFQNKQYFV
jgi:hypothetical protein